MTITRQHMRSCLPPHSMCAAILSPSSNIFPLATANPFSSLDPLPAVLRHHDFHMAQYLHRIWLSRLQPLCFAPHLPEMREEQLDHLPLCDRMDAALEIAPAAYMRSHSGRWSSCTSRISG